MNLPIPMMILFNTQAEEEVIGCAPGAKLKRKSSSSTRGRPARKKTMIMKEKKTVEKDLPVIHVRNLDEFVEKVVTERQLPNKETLLIKLGIDEGQKMLKVCLSIIHLLAEDVPDTKAYQRRFLDSGVKKVFLVAVTPAKETYGNLRKVMELLGCQSSKLHLRISADIKCINLLCGIGCALSTFPCPFCLWRYDAGDIGDSELRSFQSIIDSYNAWKESGGKAKDLKHFYNCKDLPLPIYNDPNQLVNSVFCCPVLHILQGIFNTMFKDAEEKFPGIAAWPKALNQKREEYHGSIFEARL